MAAFPLGSKLTRRAGREVKNCACTGPGQKYTYVWFNSFLYLTPPFQKSAIIRWPMKLHGRFTKPSFTHGWNSYMPGVAAVPPTPNFSPPTFHCFTQFYDFSGLLASTLQFSMLCMQNWLVPMLPDIHHIFLYVHRSLRYFASPMFRDKLQPWFIPTFGCPAVASGAGGHGLLVSTVGQLVISPCFGDAECVR